MASFSAIFFTESWKIRWVTVFPPTGSWLPTLRPLYRDCSLRAWDEGIPNGEPPEAMGKLRTRRILTPSQSRGWSGFRARRWSPGVWQHQIPWRRNRKTSPLHEMCCWLAYRCHAQRGSAGAWEDRKQPSPPAAIAAWRAQAAKGRCTDIASVGWLCCFWPIFFCIDRSFFCIWPMFFLTGSLPCYIGPFFSDWQICFVTFDRFFRCIGKFFSGTSQLLSFVWWVGALSPACFQSFATRWQIIFPHLARL